MRKSIFLAIFSLIITTSLFAQERDYSFVEKFEVGNSAELNIKTSDGFIDVLPSEKNTIEVFYIVKRNNRLLDISRSELEDHLEISVQHHGNDLEIIVRHHRNFGWMNWRNRYNVSFEVYVPVKTRCTLQSSDGSIYLSDLVGDQYCKTSDGNIKVMNIDGALEAKTSDGNISVGRINGRTELKTSDGNIIADHIVGDSDFETSDGHIDIIDVKGATYVHTSDGNIKFRDLQGSISGRTSDGSITGNFLKLNGDVKLGTSDGGIRLTLPQGLGLELKLRGERIQTDLYNFSGSHSKRSIKGTIGNGEFLIDMHTSDGKITLDYK